MAPAGGGVERALRAGVRLGPGAPSELGPTMSPSGLSRCCEPLGSCSEGNDGRQTPHRSRGVCGVRGVSGRRAGGRGRGRAGRAAGGTCGERSPEGGQGWGQSSLGGPGPEPHGDSRSPPPRASVSSSGNEGAGPSAPEGPGVSRAAVRSPRARVNVARPALCEPPGLPGWPRGLPRAPTPHVVPTHRTRGAEDNRHPSPRLWRPEPNIKVGFLPRRGGGLSPSSPTLLPRRPVA